MRLKEMSIESAVRAVYDTDLGKNTWDGRVLKINSWNCLIYKIGTIIPTGVLMFTNYMNPCDNTIKIMKLRREKYQSRGFTITYHQLRREINSYLWDIFRKNGSKSHCLIELVDDGTINIAREFGIK